MSYIEKEKLIKGDIDSIENKVRHAFNQGYDLGFKDGKKRAKPQGQEPQPMVEIDLYSVIKQKYIEREVLDKIRAEIKALSPEPTAFDVVDGNPIKDAVWETLADVLEIIDKYKAESEE